MNGRIKYFAEQALDNAVPETWTTLSYDQLQKFQQEFARLIVDDCCSTISQVVDARIPASEYVNVLKDLYTTE